jgi:hypothetical protein
MKELLNELLTDQAFLAIFPMLSFGILGAIVVSYLVYKRRRESRSHSQNRRD